MNKSDTIAIIRSILSSTKSNYSVGRLNVDFKKETGMDIPLFGYGNLSDFLHSIPDTVQVSGMYPIQKVHLVNNEKSSHIVSLVNRTRNSGFENKCSKSKSRKAKFNNGFRKGDIQKSSNIFGLTDLDRFRGIKISPETNSQLKQLTSSSKTNSQLKQLTSSSKTNSQLKQLTSSSKTNSQLKRFTRSSETNSQLKQFTRSSETNSQLKQFTRSSETNSQLENSSSTCLNSPDSRVSLINFLGVNDSIPRIDIKKHAQVGDYVEVCPDHIYGPHKFYFRFRKFQKKFGDLTDKMQSFYKRSENIPEMSDTSIKPKLLCAVFHKIRRKPKWVRGEITQIVNKSHVHVTFIDYGFGAEVSKRNLKFLHQDFSSLPRQAVLGSLANIRPSKGESKWSSEAIERFSSLARDMDLIAGVVAVNAEACSVSVALSCTRGLEYHINDTLVKEGYAEFWTTVDNLKLSHKNNFGKLDAVMSATEFMENDVLKSTTNRVSPTLGTPIFYYSSDSSNNKRLKQMFSDAA